MTADAERSLPDVEARLDKLTQALLHVAGELWVTRDRQATLERVLAEAGIAAPTLIDSYRPDASLAAALKVQREAFVAGILAYLVPETESA